MLNRQANMHDQYRYGNVGKYVIARCVSLYSN